MARVNIINPTTGQTGYQVPGAAIPPGWQPIGSPTLLSLNQATPTGPSLPNKSTLPTPTLPQTTTPGNELVNFSKVMEDMLQQTKQSRAQALLGVADTIPTGALDASSFGQLLSVAARSSGDFMNQVTKQAFDTFYPEPTTPTGDIGRYQQAIQTGIIPQGTSYFDFLGQEAAATRAPQSAGGGSNQITDNERALLSTFQSSPIVKDYNQIVSQKLAVDNIINNGVGGPSDLSLVYSFMKGLDPNSVVRETEYATAAKSGNIFLGQFAKFNGYFKEKGGFLPANVKQEFQNIVNQRLKAQQSQYDNYAKEFRNIAERQGLNPDNVVVNFSGALPNETSINDKERIFQEVVKSQPQETPSLWSTFLNQLLGY